MAVAMKKKAFLMADAVFSVLVTILCIVTLDCLLMSLKTMNKTNHHENQAVFSYVQFNNFLHDGKNVYAVPSASNSSRAVFTKVERKGSKKSYRIEKYQDMVRVRATQSGGHMPLILHVRDADFQTSSGQIVMHLIERDGRKSDLYFKLDRLHKD